jgi:S-adenosyl-L-methionine hydrolase (adenosine-forming)
MRFITLLTDYQFKDFYLSKVKSRVYKLFPEHTLLEICHEIEAYNLKEASYAFNAMLPEFSKDDLHFIFVNLHYEKNYSVVLAKTSEHGTIIAPNNGILGLLNVNIETVYELPIEKNSFVELDIMSKVSALNTDFLTKIENPYLLKHPESRENASELRGEVIYIDQYGNCVVNINQTTFDLFVENSVYHINFRREVVERISTDYSDNWQAGPAVFFNEQGWMEVSCVHGNASKLFGLKYQTKISVKKN